MNLGGTCPPCPNVEPPLVSQYSVIIVVIKPLRTTIIISKLEQRRIPFTAPKIVG